MPEPTAQSPGALALAARRDPFRGPQDRIAAEIAAVDAAMEAQTGESCERIGRAILASAARFRAHWRNPSRLTIREFRQRTGAGGDLRAIVGRMIDDADCSARDVTAAFRAARTIADLDGRAEFNADDVETAARIAGMLPNDDGGPALTPKD